MLSFEVLLQGAANKERGVFFLCFSDSLLLMVLLLSKFVCAIIISLSRGGEQMEIYVTRHVVGHIRKSFVHIRLDV